MLPALVLLLLIAPLARAEFVGGPLLFVSERGDLHLRASKAHSNFFKGTAADSYKYGERSHDGDVLLSAETFYKMIEDDRQSGGHAPIILFVHGCCVSFGEQILQANDLKKAIDTAYARSPSQHPGRPLLIDYDWVAPLSYASSVVHCYSAQDRFNSFMQDFVARYGASNIIIVAHSLGSLMVQNYANQIKDNQLTEPFRTIVFSRSDVDSASFSACLPALKAHSKRFLVLSASNDPNILCSSLLRQFGVKFARAAKLPLPINKNKVTAHDHQLASEDADDNDAVEAPVVTESDTSTKHLDRRLGQVKVARKFGSSLEVYDMSGLRMGHGIPYQFIGDALFAHMEDFDLKKDDFGVVIVHKARP